MADELFELRNSYYIGNFHQTIAEANGVKTVSKRPEDIHQFNAERDALVALAQIGLGQYDAVLGDLRTAVHPLLVGVRNFAQFSKEHAHKLDPTKSLLALVDPVKDATPNHAQAPLVVLAANALVTSQDVSSALKLVGSWSAKLDPHQSLRYIIELRAITADGYLRIHRADLAEKEVAAMKAMDDESILTFLTTAITALRLGVTKKEKFVEAESAVREAATRAQHSVTTLNLLALAQLGQGKLQDAERALLDALGKRSGDPDTLANLALIAAQQSKPADATLRYVSQLKATAPNSVWAAQYLAMEGRFADAAKAF